MIDQILESFKATHTKRPAGYRGLYVLLKNNVVVYVGQSENILSRLTFHHQKQYDSYAICLIPYGNMNEWEAQLIVKYKPVYNSTLPVNETYISTHGIKAITQPGKRHQLTKAIRLTGLREVIRFQQLAYYERAKVLELIRDIDPTILCGKVAI